jgi:hypothetical protein
VLDVFPHDGSKVPLAHRHDVTQALGLERPDETLGVAVQVRASRRQAQQLHVGRCQDLLEVSGVQRVPVDDEMAGVFQEAACRVGEVASDLRHPCPVGTVREAGDVSATSLQIDNEEDEVANQPADRQHLNAEEVGRCDRAPMSPQECAPRKRLASARGRLEALGRTLLAELATLATPAGHDSRRSPPRQRAPPLRKPPDSRPAQFPDTTG